MSTVIIILSDPKAGEDAFGRVFNGLLLGLQLKDKGENIEIIFQGTGARWPAELAKEDNPAHPLFVALKDNMAGVCSGCANVFGATEGVESTNLKLLKDFDLPGVGGTTDLAKYVINGDRILTF